MTVDIAVTGCFWAALTVLAWWVAMLRLRDTQWTASGALLDSDKQPDTDSAQAILYHNQAIYRDFEFFFKVTLALLGGIAFLVTRGDASSAQVNALLLPVAGGLEVLAAALLSLFVFLHQKSKIRRWQKRYDWWEPVVWQETWMVAAMIGVAFATAFSAVPLLLAV